MAGNTGVLVLFSLLITIIVVSFMFRNEIKEIVPFWPFGSSGVELTADDWDEKTAGKSVFIKFLAPW